jgi:fatty-acyl-CoA synthase
MSESSVIAQRFKALALSQPHKLAIRFGMPGQTEDHDFAKFWRRVERVTGHLQNSFGLKAGQRVAWLGLNHELQCVTLVACARLGLIFMPLNYRLAVPELSMVLEDATPSLLVYDALHQSTAQSLTVQQANELSNELPNVSLPSCLPTCLLDRLIDQPSSKHIEYPQIAESSDLLLVYTSGTTGLPKGAVHTQAGLMANAQASHEAHHFQGNDIVLSTLPLFHVGGLCIQTLPALLAGVSVYLHPRFDPSAWLRAVSEGALEDRPSLSLLVPATLRAVLDHPDWPQADLKSLRGIMTGSSTLPVSYLERFHARGVPVGQIYGATETGPVSVVLKLQDAMKRVGFAGWPHANLSLKLIDADGQEVPRGATGEVCVKAPNVMRGYWSTSGAQTQEGLIDGWFHSGDMGFLDQEGCLQIVGRNKDMIISGGENIYPAEIENALMAYPGVAECAVVGLPDEKWGEVPVLALTRQPTPEGLQLSTEEILAHLQNNIARFKLPRRVLFLEQLPKSALGKVLKPLLLKQLMDSNS